MISNFFVLSPRGDTILAKQYRINDRNSETKEIGAHERSHTEAFFRKIKFWDDLTKSTGGDDIDDDDVINNSATGGGGGNDGPESAANGEINGSNKQQQVNDRMKIKYDAPPVFPMPDGYTYFHVKRNGLIFGASSVRNVSPSTVLEVSSIRVNVKWV